MEKAVFDFKLYLLAANDTIADLIYPKYLDYLCQKVIKGKLKITYILAKPPPIWNGLSGLIDDTKLYNWISQNYSIPPPAIPPRLSSYNHGGDKKSNLNDYSNPNKNNLINYPIQEEIEEIEEIELNDPHHDRLSTKTTTDTVKISPSRNKSSSSRSPSTSPHSPSRISPLSNTPPHLLNEMILMNERHNYMRLFAMDDSKRVKLVVCGSVQFNESIRKSLEKIGFPIKEKALFID